MIYVEYDGSGHNLSVKKGDMTQALFNKNQRKRTYALYRDGWRCIRLVSRKDYLPQDDALQRIILEAIAIIEDGRSFVVIDIDQGIISHAKQSVSVDFGELHRLKNPKRW